MASPEQCQGGQEPRTLTLAYAMIGVGAKCVVDVDSGATVSGLMDAIYSANRVACGQCDASQLKPHLAKQRNGQWLTYSSPAIQAVLEGEASEKLLMNPLTSRGHIRVLRAVVHTQGQRHPRAGGAAAAVPE